MSFPINNETWDKYVAASLTGAARGLSGLPLEHPFDCVKTCWQANPELPSASKVAEHIYAKKGPRGFYAGAIPNGTRMVLKQTYRFPLMMALPSFYSKHLSDTIKKVPFVEEGLTGITIASLESGVITPFERLKVTIMTSEKQKGNIVKFIVANRSHLARESFRGFQACYIRQIVTWSTFSVADAFFKSKARQLTNKGPLEPLDFPTLMTVGFCVGAINTAAVMPFDFVKTQVQKQDPRTQGIIAIMRHFKAADGVSVLYTGWRVKMVHYMLHSAYTVSLLDRLKVSWNSDQK